MASYGSWKTLQEYGLLGSEALCDLFEVEAAKRSRLLSSQRRDLEVLTHPKHGSVTLRDQKVLSEKNLNQCLQGCKPTEWNRILNERVFFWLNRDRLIGFLSAREYFEKFRTVLELDGPPFVAEYEKQIELTHMNTGNSCPIPHPRSPSTFKPYLHIHTSSARG